MGRKRKNRVFDALQKKSDELKQKKNRKAKEKGIPAVYPFSPAELEDFHRGACKYREGTESYNRVQAAYEESEATRPQWEKMVAQLKEWESAIREATVHALLSSGGRGWPMMVFWWIEREKVIGYKTPDSSPGITQKEAIRRFFLEFRSELDICFPSAKETSLAPKLRAVTAEDWEVFREKMVQLHHLNPTPYSRAMLHYW